MKITRSKHDPTTGNFGPTETVKGAVLNQLSPGRNGVARFYLWRPDGKWPDGSPRRKSWELFGCDVFVFAADEIAIEGFVEDEPIPGVGLSPRTPSGVFRRECWRVCP